MGPFVVRTWCRVVAEPMAVVDRDPHLGRIAVVQAVGTAVVLVAPIVLRVVHVRIMVEPFPIERVVGVAPRRGRRPARRPSLGGQQMNGGQHQRRNGKIDPADHRSPLSRLQVADCDGRRNCGQKIAGKVARTEAGVSSSIDRRYKPE